MLEKVENACFPNDVYNVFRLRLFTGDSGFSIGSGLKKDFHSHAILQLVKSSFGGRTTLRVLRAYRGCSAKDVPSFHIII